jgi:site-specific DNA-cytosine methylase
MKKILIGGSPCTHWSIAQKNNRETEAEGIGWELFRNYLIAKEKFQPDFFLYENNKSASQPIKDQVSLELGVQLQYIDSALVSAQKRQRFYAHNIPNVEQPEDRGILLRDILESGEAIREKAYALKKHQGNCRDYFKKRHTQVVAEQVKLLTEKEMEYMVRQTRDGRNHFDFGHYSNSAGDKAHAVTANMSKGVPYNVLADPIRIGTIENELKNENHDSKQYRVYSPEGKSTTICGQGGGVGAKTGLYACPATGREEKVYEVRDGMITVNGQQYPIRLADGIYIIRKLTVTECCRLQTLPDDYCRAVSATQAYKGLGNGWTAEVIIHILKHMNIPLNEEIVVLSLYDGIGTGRYCFDKMGYKNIRYYAYEIDKYAMQIAMSNYPDIIQCGDAFQVREAGWNLKY